MKTFAKVSIALATLLALAICIRVNLIEDMLSAYKLGHAAEAEIMRAGATKIEPAKPYKGLLEGTVAFTMPNCDATYYAIPVNVTVDADRLVDGFRPVASGNYERFLIHAGTISTQPSRVGMQLERARLMFLAIVGLADKWPLNDGIYLAVPKSCGQPANVNWRAAWQQQMAAAN